MGDDVRLYAVNAQIGASRLGEHGAALDAVARLLTEQSQATSPLVASVADRAGAAVRDLDEMAFDLSVSAIQAEMVAMFAHQIAGTPELAATHAPSMLALSDALSRGNERTFAPSASVAQRLVEVFSYVDARSAPASADSPACLSTAVSSSRACLMPARSRRCSPMSSGR